MINSKTLTETIEAGDIEPPLRPLREGYHLVQCQFCGLELERFNKNVKATCFDCKMKKQIESGRERRQRNRGKRASLPKKTYPRYYWPIDTIRASDLS